MYQSSAPHYPSPHTWTMMNLPCLVTIERAMRSTSCIALPSGKHGIPSFTSQQLEGKHLLAWSVTLSGLLVSSLKSRNTVSATIRRRLKYRVDVGHIMIRNLKIIRGNHITASVNFAMPTWRPPNGLLVLRNGHEITKFSSQNYIDWTRK